MTCFCLPPSPFSRTSRGRIRTPRALRRDSIGWNIYSNPYTCNDVASKRSSNETVLLCTAERSYNSRSRSKRPRIHRCHLSTFKPYPVASPRTRVQAISPVLTTMCKPFVPHATTMEHAPHRIPRYFHLLPANPVTITRHIAPTLLTITTP